MCCCNIHCHSNMFTWPSGVPGDAEAAGHSAPPGAGEGEADAFGAAETHDPDESPDACFLPALCPGTHCFSSIKEHFSWQTNPTFFHEIFFILLRRCSLCLLMSLEGWYTSLVVHPATLAPSAPLVLWRARLCTTCTWISRGRLHRDSTRPCPLLPQVSSFTRKSIMFTVCSQLIHKNRILWNYATVNCLLTPAAQNISTSEPSSAINMSTLLLFCSSTISSWNTEFQPLPWLLKCI